MRELLGALLKPLPLLATETAVFLGKIEGLRGAVELLLSERLGTVSASVRQKLASIADLSRLSALLGKAASASSLAEFEAALGDAASAQSA